MNEIFKTSEILGTIDLPKGECELTASAEAEYAEGNGSLVVHLNAAVHRRNAPMNEDTIPVAWLPPNETVTEFAPIEEASEIARDIFRGWVRKVRGAAPALHQPTFT